MRIEIRKKQRLITHCLYFMMCGLLYRLCYEAGPDIDMQTQTGIVPQQYRSLEMQSIVSSRTPLECPELQEHLLV